MAPAAGAPDSGAHLRLVTAVDACMLVVKVWGFLPVVWLLWSTVGGDWVFKALAGQSLPSLDAGISVGNATPSWNAFPLGSQCAE